MENNITFTGNTQRELDGQGLLFTSGNTTKHFIMREGNLWANTNINLTSGYGLMYNNTLVLKQNELGSTVVKSNLKEVGILKNLTVGGHANLGNTLKVDSDFRRVGIGTDAPNAGLSVVDNGVELVIGSHKNDTGKIGTYTADDLVLVTDNTDRLLITRSGEVIVGHAKFKNGVLRVHGKIIVDSIETSNRNNKAIEFVAPDWHTEPVTTGLVWLGSGKRSLTFEVDPDRLVSTEIIDLAKDRYYCVDGAMVISKNTLGATVTESSLTKLGTLQNLSVYGTVKFDSKGEVLTFDKGLHLTSNNNTISFDSQGVKTSNSFEITVDGESEITVSAAGHISIGNRHNTNRVVSVYGQLSVGVRHPDPTVSFTTAGTMSFAGKKFITGDSVPVLGQFNKGDICWNIDPKVSDYVGWVCVMSGTPGQWEPFGAIGK